MTDFWFTSKHGSLDVFLFSKDGETINQVRVKFQDEVTIMSSEMFFEIFSENARDIYEEAATKWQNERLSS